jgi:hypothetical protein
MKWHTSYLAPFLHDRQHAALQIPTTDRYVFWWHTQPQVVQGQPVCVSVHTFDNLCALIYACSFDSICA